MLYYHATQYYYETQNTILPFGYNKGGINLQPSVKKINSKELLMEVDIDEIINKLCNDLFPNKDKTEINEALRAICGESTIKSDKAKLYFERLNEILEYYLKELLPEIIINRCKEDEYRCSFIRLFSEMEKAFNNQDKNTNFNFTPLYKPYFINEWRIFPGEVQAPRFKYYITWKGTSPDRQKSDFDYYLPLNFETNVISRCVIRNDRIVVSFQIEFIVPTIATCSFRFIKFHPVNIIKFEYNNIIRNYEPKKLYLNPYNLDIKKFVNTIYCDLLKNIKYFANDIRMGIIRL